MLRVLLRNEVCKLCRTKLPYFGFAAVLLVCLLTYVVAGGTGLGGDVRNGWGYVALSMQMVFADIGMIFLAIFSAMLVAEETGTGTARLVLSCPVRRWEFYSAKVLTGLGYMVLLSAASLLLSIVLGSLKYDFGEVADSVGVVYGFGEVLGNFVIAFLLSWLPLGALVIYGVFISVLAKKSGQAIGVVIGTIILAETVKHLIGIGPYVFTTYQGSSWSIFHEVAMGVDYEWLSQIWKLLGVCVTYCVVGFGAGMLSLGRRDLNF